jgi:hypothetical protein
MSTDSNLHDLITQKFGNHCGLNADWVSCAWLVSPNARANRTHGAYYLVEDEENDTYSLYRHNIDEAVGDSTAEHCLTFRDDSHVMEFLENPFLPA